MRKQERAHARIVGDLTEAKAGGLLCDFRVIEHSEAFPTQADDSLLATCSTRSSQEVRLGKAGRGWAGVKPVGRITRPASAPVRFSLAGAL